jgi:hypothetical protein
MTTIFDYYNGSADKTSPFVLQEIRGAIPIPVDSRVEIRIFYSDGIFGIGANEPDFTNPSIKILETGIQYLSSSGVHAGTPFSSDEKRVFATLTGKVMACQIVFRPGNNYRYQETTLLIEPENPQAVIMN